MPVGPLRRHASLPLGIRRGMPVGPLRRHASQPLGPVENSEGLPATPRKVVA